MPREALFLCCVLERGFGGSKFLGSADSALDRKVVLPNLSAAAAEEGTVLFVHARGTAQAAAEREVPSVQFSAERTGVRHGHTKDRINNF